MTEGLAMDEVWEVVCIVEEGGVVVIVVVLVEIEEGCGDVAT